MRPMITNPTRRFLRLTTASGRTLSTDLASANRNFRHLAIAVFATLMGAAVPLGAQSILKTAGNYSVLAGQGITVAGTGFSIVDGNVGLFPAATTNITGFPPGTVTGTTLAGTAAGIISTGGATQQAECRPSGGRDGFGGHGVPTANYSSVDLANLGPSSQASTSGTPPGPSPGALILDAQGKNNVFMGVPVPEPGSRRPSTPP